MHSVSEVKIEKRNDLFLYEDNIELIDVSYQKRFD